MLISLFKIAYKKEILKKLLPARGAREVGRQAARSGLRQRAIAPYERGRHTMYGDEQGAIGSATLTATKLAEISKARR